MIAEQLANLAREVASKRIADLKMEIQKTRMARDDVERRITQHIKHGEDLSAVNLEDEAIFLTSKIDSLTRRLEREIYG